MASERIELTGSTNGRGIDVAVIATPGTLIHTVPEGFMDVVTLFGNNREGVVARLLTIEFGGVAQGDLITRLITAAEELITITDELLLQGQAGGTEIRAFAATANIVSVHGFVTRTRI